MNLTGSLNSGSATLNNALKNMRILWEATKAEWNDCNASATPFCTRSDGPLAYGEDNAVPARPTNERGWQCGKRWQRRSSSSKPRTRHSDVCSETPFTPAPPAATNPTPLDL